MIVPVERPVDPAITPKPRRLYTGAVLAVALAAGAVLMLGGQGHVRPVAARGRSSATTAWAQARHAEIPGRLPDGSFFTPTTFIDANTAIGTAPSVDGIWSRLLIRHADGTVRQLCSLPIADYPDFDHFATSGNDVVWTQASGKLPMQVWTANLQHSGPARLLTGDTRDAVFGDNQYDFVFADGRVYWTAAPDNSKVTEIRSLPVAGGPVTTRTERGEWTLSIWPWLTDDAAGLDAGTTRMRNMITGRDLAVLTSGTEVAACTPVWCRMTAVQSGNSVGIFLMHPDGSGRRRIADGNAQAAATDVAVLDRFEIFLESGPDTDATSMAALLVYDISTGHTVNLSPATKGAFVRNEVLWWSTGNDDARIWHTVDLRTA